MKSIAIRQVLFFFDFVQIGLFKWKTYIDHQNHKIIAIIIVISYYRINSDPHNCSILLKNNRFSDPSNESNNIVNFMPESIVDIFHFVDEYY